MNLHFIAFVEVDGCLYELDGRKESPVNHGPTSRETLLQVQSAASSPPVSHTSGTQDACRIVKQFMARDPNNLNFNLMALAPTDAA